MQREMMIPLGFFHGPVDEVEVSVYVERFWYKSKSNDDYIDSLPRKNQPSTDKLVFEVCFIIKHFLQPNKESES